MTHRCLTVCCYDYSWSYHYSFTLIIFDVNT